MCKEKIHSFVVQCPEFQPAQSLTLDSLADLFSGMSSRLDLEASRYAAINVGRLFVPTNPTLSLARYSFIQRSEL